MARSNVYEPVAAPNVARSSMPEPVFEPFKRVASLPPKKVEKSGPPVQNSHISIVETIAEAAV